MIRIVLPTGALESPAPAPRRLSKRVLLSIAGLVAALVGWFGVSMLKDEPAPATPTSASAPIAKSSSVESGSPLAEPVTAISVETKPADAPLAPITEVIPDVPQSALNTIRGTIRVSVRATIDKGGAVVAATVEEPGPSRYFRRLALEASRKWTFTPAANQEQRTVMLRFHFRRSGVTAQAQARD